MAEQPTTTDTTSSPATNDSPAANDANTEQVTGTEQVAGRFIGQWNRLISTTNWEKGRIICQWREAMMLEGMPVTEYSDEAWAQLVGGVTSQHVGRLRRVSQRFGDVTDQYEGLYWSHFQAALDWDDAEMWLEGSLQNDWSVSQMRGKRWETLGTTPEAQKEEEKQLSAELTDEAQAEESADTTSESSSEEASAPSTVTSTTTEMQSSDTAEASQDSTGEASEEGASESVNAAPKRTRLNVDVESLPDDMADAFESFKLAIIAHRREGWRDTTPESVVECLDALKQLALAEE